MRSRYGRFVAGLPPWIAAVLALVLHQSAYIADVTRALADGYTTGSGLGLGLGGAKRLSNEFEISSVPGQGTRVRIARWL